MVFTPSPERPVPADPPGGGGPDHSYREGLLVLPNLVIVAEAALSLASLATSMCLEWRRRPGRCSCFLRRVSLASASSSVNGAILALFVEAGGAVVVAVRIAATIMAENIVPEHLIFGLGSGFFYLCLSVLRLAGSLGTRNEMAASAPAEGDSLALGALEAATSAAYLSEFVLRVARGGGEVLRQPDKTVFGMPTMLLVPEAAASALVFLLFLVYGPPDDISSLKANRSKRITARTTTTRASSSSELNRESWTYSVLVNPAFLYVDAVLLISVPWGDKDNIMTSIFSILSGATYLLAGLLYMHLQRTKKAKEAKDSRSRCWSSSCSLLGLLSLSAAAVYSACGFVFAAYRTEAFRKWVEEWDAPVD